MVVVSREMGGSQGLVNSTPHPPPNLFNHPDPRQISSMLSLGHKSNINEELTEYKLNIVSKNIIIFTKFN